MHAVAKVPGQQANPLPRHPPAKSGDCVEGLRDRRQGVQRDLQVADIGPAGTTQLRQLVDQIPLDRRDGQDSPTAGRVVAYEKGLRSPAPRVVVGVLFRDRRLRITLPTCGK